MVVRVVINEGQKSEPLPTKKTLYFTKNTTLPASRDVNNHFPKCLDNRQECWLCRYRIKEEKEEAPGGRGMETQWQCTICEIPLCLTISRNTHPHPVHNMDQNGEISQYRPEGDLKRPQTS
jgi:hypothetical protein